MADKARIEKVTQRLLPDGYSVFLKELKQRIRDAQLRASVAVNSQLVLLYWQIGHDILVRQEDERWGAKVIDRLSEDLRKSFPGMKGFSPRNLKYMQAFADAWPEKAFVQEALAQIIWYHNVTLIEELATTEDRIWYANASIQNGWSRSVLVHQIETGLHNRSGKAITNFEKTLPPAESDLARQITKDPYVFDFLTLGEDLQERELESGLLKHLQHFLLELGTGFAFVGRQYRLDVGGTDFFIDLLFYHLKLRRYFVIDLNMVSFQAEFAGKMNFYLAAVDDLLRYPDDEPTIGLIICKTKNQVVAEYALRNLTTPIGISEYDLAQALPSVLERSLPTIEELTIELSRSNEEGH